MQHAAEIALILVETGINVALASLEPQAEYASQKQIRGRHVHHG
jgi:hypothetical protein